MWIESHQSLRNHPKVIKAARLAGISRVEMIGRLHYFWWWALDYAQDGDITKYDDADIESAIDWPGERGLFVTALIDCGNNGQSGLIDVLPDGSRYIHDWHQYAGKLIEYREKDASRKREIRRTSTGHPRDIQPESSGSPSVTYLPTYLPLPTDTNQPTKPSSAEKAPRATAKQIHNESIDALTKIFSQWTSIPCPNGVGPKGTLAVRWYAPLNRIWTLCNKDTTQSAELIQKAIARMREEKLTIAAPQSIEKVAMSIYGENGAAKSRNVAADWQKALKR